MKRPLFALLAGYRFKLALAFFCIVLANLSALVFPWSIKILLDDVLPRHNHAPLAWLLPALAAATLLKAVFDYAGSCLSLEAGERAVADLREKIYRHVLRLPVTTVENFSTGELISRLIADTESVKRFLFSGILDILYSAFCAIFVVTVLWAIDAKLAVFAAAALVLFLVVYGKMTGKLKDRYALLRRRHAEISGRCGEVFRGIRTVRLFDRSGMELRKFLAWQNEILQNALKAYSGDTWFLVSAEFLSSAALILLLVYGVRRIEQAQMSVGSLVAGYTYIGFLFLPLLKMTATGGAYREASASLERIQNLLDCAPEPEETGHSLDPQKMRGHLQFQDVHFSYPDSRAALSGIDLEVLPGEWVVLMGPNGSGKTTLACLLARLLEPVSGRILMDGQDIRTILLKDYRYQVAVVLQNDFLFAGTIAENIRYGNAAVDDRAINVAAAAVGIRSFVGQLPRHYETLIGEGGVKLSGGQRQRIALARALLRDPAILVLDEALSGVDADSVPEIMRAVRKIRKDRTTFIVTHRLPPLEPFDKIVMMSEGKIEDISQPHAV